MSPLATMSLSMQSAAAVAERLFDCAQDTLFFVKNREARYTAVNRTLVDRCGARSKRELLGRTATELFPAPFGAAYYAQDRAVLDLGIEIHDRLQEVPGSAGRQAWCISYKFPIVENNGVVGLCGICRTLTPADAGSASLSQVALAIDYIQRHYGETLRIDALAHAAGLGTRRLERLMKRLFDLTPMQLLAKTRIDAATHMLAHEPHSVAQIASACGYSDQSAFTRQFKALVGATPQHFRASRKAAGAAS